MSSGSESSRRTAPRVAVAATAVTAATYAVLLAGRDTIFAVAGKEQLLETLGALAFLVTGVLCLVAARRERGRRRLGRALLGLFFLFACGEELSWGQHALGFETPEAVREHNRQEELNLHNLDLFDSWAERGRRKSGLAALMSANRLFDYFMLALFVVLPAAGRISRALPAALERWGVPFVAPIFMLPFFVNIAATGFAELWRVDSNFLHLAVSEIREFNYALLCLLGLGCVFRAPLSRM